MDNPDALNANISSEEASIGITIPKMMEQLMQMQAFQAQMQASQAQMQAETKEQFSILSEEIRKLQTYEAKKESIEVVKKEDLPLGQKVGDKQLFVRNPPAMQDPEVTFNLGKGHLVAGEETDSPTIKEANSSQSQSFLFQTARDFKQDKPRNSYSPDSYESYGGQENAFQNAFTSSQYIKAVPQNPILKNTSEEEVTKFSQAVLRLNPEEIHAMPHPQLWVDPSVFSYLFGSYSMEDQRNITPKQIVIAAIKRCFRSCMKVENRHLIITQHIPQLRENANPDEIIRWASAVRKRCVDATQLWYILFEESQVDQIKKVLKKRATFKNALLNSFMENVYTVNKNSRSMNNIIAIMNILISQAEDMSQMLNMCHYTPTASSNAYSGFKKTPNSVHSSGNFGGVSFESMDDNKRILAQYLKDQKVELACHDCGQEGVKKNHPNCKNPGTPNEKGRAAQLKFATALANFKLTKQATPFGALEVQPEELFDNNIITNNNIIS
jgi:hypothetical protein